MPTIPIFSCKIRSFSRVVNLRSKLGRRPLQVWYISFVCTDNAATFKPSPAEKVDCRRQDGWGDRRFCKQNGAFFSLPPWGRGTVATVDEEIEFCAVQTTSTSSVTRDFASQNVSLRERDCHLPHGGRLRETTFNTPTNTDLSFKFWFIGGFVQTKWRRTILKI